jgi:hypothetical protein
VNPSRRLWELLLLLLGVAVTYYISSKIPQATIARDAGAAVVVLIILVGLLLLWEERAKVSRIRPQWPIYIFREMPPPAESDLASGNETPLSKGSALQPSREDLYNSLCEYSFGMGVTKTRREIIVDDDGSVEVTTSQSRVIRVPQFRRLGSFESWAAAIVPTSVELTVPEHPGKNTPIPHKDFELAEIDGKAIPGGKLKWLVEFPDPLDVNSLLTVALRYRTEAGAIQQEYYLVSIAMPIKDFELIIRPRVSTHRQFVGGKTLVEGLDQERDHLRDLEEGRSQPQAFKGGYRIALEYPLVGSRLRVSWLSRPI